FTAAVTNRIEQSLVSHVVLPTRVRHVTRVRAPALGSFSAPIAAVTPRTLGVEGCACVGGRRRYIRSREAKRYARDCKQAEGAEDNCAKPQSLVCVHLIPPNRTEQYAIVITPIDFVCPVMRSP